MPQRRIVLACLTPRPDGGELASLELPSYGIRRIQAAVVADPLLAGTPLRLVDHGRADVAAYVRDILAAEPDLLGFSIYVWSTACMVEVARQVKRQRPRCTIVFGGPSARSAVFDLPPYQHAGEYLDAVVETDGEFIFRDIARLPELDRAALETVPGLVLPLAEGWHRTAPRLLPTALDDIPSPFQLGLMPPGTVAYLETYRGCPLSCRFCEWGVSAKSRAVFSAEYLERELAAFARVDAPSVFLLDAGLNLNGQAFRNLHQAHKANPFLRNTSFWAEIYPATVREEHMEFLHEVGASYLGVGLQSTDPEVLRLHQRPSNPPQFEAAVRKLAEVATLELQVIFGLPGDTPAGFRRTLEFALSMPAAVRAYHALVLPDALLTRGLPEWEMRFSHDTLAMQSCAGWAATDIAAMRAELARRSRAMGGLAGEYWWSFPPGASAERARVRRRA